MKVERVHITEIWPDLSHAESLIRRPLLATGILMIILGVIAILLPFVATLTMTLFVGILLVVAGVTHIAHSFETHGSKGWLLRLIGGILYALAGIFLLAAPARGMVTLTVVLVVLFLLVGIDKIFRFTCGVCRNGWQQRKRPDLDRSGYHDLAGTA